MRTCPGLGGFYTRNYDADDELNLFKCIVK